MSPVGGSNPFLSMLFQALSQKQGPPALNNRSVGGAGDMAQVTMPPLQPFSRAEGAAANPPPAASPFGGMPQGQPSPPTLNPGQYPPMHGVDPRISGGSGAGGMKPPPRMFEGMGPPISPPQTPIPNTGMAGQDRGQQPPGYLQSFIQMILGQQPQGQTFDPKNPSPGYMVPDWRAPK